MWTQGLVEKYEASRGSEGEAPPEIPLGRLQLQEVAEMLMDIKQIRAENAASSEREHLPVVLLKHCSLMLTN